MLEDENVAANIFIEPNDGGVTDEDSGEEDGGGFLSNLSGKQLNAPAEIFSSTQKCSSEETSSHSPETFSCFTSQPNITNSIPKPDESEKLRKSSYQTPKWKKINLFQRKICLFRKQITRNTETFLLQNCLNYFLTMTYLICWFSSLFCMHIVKEKQTFL